MVDTGKIKGKLAENGYTIRSIAKKMNIHEATLSKKIHNKQPMTTDEMAVFIDELKIEAEDIRSIFLV